MSKNSVTQVDILLWYIAWVVKIFKKFMMEENSVHQFPTRRRLIQCLYWTDEWNEWRIDELVDYFIGLMLNMSIAGSADRPIDRLIGVRGGWLNENQKSEEYDPLINHLLSFWLRLIDHVLAQSWFASISSVSLFCYLDQAYWHY